MQQKTIEIEVDDYSCQPRAAHDNSILGRAKAAQNTIADDLLSLGQAKRELERRIQTLYDQQDLLKRIISTEQTA